MSLSTISPPRILEQDDYVTFQHILRQRLDPNTDDNKPLFQALEIFVGIQNECWEEWVDKGRKVYVKRHKEWVAKNPGQKVHVV